MFTGFVAIFYLSNCQRWDLNCNACSSQENHLLFPARCHVFEKILDFETGIMYNPYSDKNIR